MISLVSGERSEWLRPRQRLGLVFVFLSASCVCCFLCVSLFLRALCMVNDSSVRGSPHATFAREGVDLVARGITKI